MRLKNPLFILLLVAPLTVISPNYIALLKVGYSENLNSTFENTTESTTVRSIDVDLRVPVVITKNNARIKGLFYSRNNLELFPQLNQTQGPSPGLRYSDNVSLHSTTLKLGIATTFNDKWNGKFVFLPRHFW